MLKYLYGVRVEEVADWYREKKDLSSLLPDDFTIPDGVKGKLARSVLKGVPVRMNGNCPAYDLILQNIYDAAGYASKEYESFGKEDGAAKMREVQVIAAFLGNDKIRPWYYENMDRFYKKIAAKVGLEDGRSAGGDTGGLREEEDAQATGGQAARA
jgi:hypothetical protein